MYKVKVILQIEIYKIFYNYFTEILIHFNKI